jgi:hypothetical protein
VKTSLYNWIEVDLKENPSFCEGNLFMYFSQLTFVIDIAFVFLAAKIYSTILVQHKPPPIGAAAFFCAIAQGNS